MNTTKMRSLTDEQQDRLSKLYESRGGRDAVVKVVAHWNRRIIMAIRIRYRHYTQEDVEAEIDFAMAKAGRHLGDTEMPMSYYSASVRNHLCSLFKMKELLIEHEIDSGYVDPSSTVPPDRVDMTPLLAAVKGLPDKQKELLHKKFFLGLTFKEIASETDTSPQSACLRMQVIIAKLHKELKGHYTQCISKSHLMVQSSK